MDQKRILLLEPDKEQSKLFANWLGEEGYQVEPIYIAEEVSPKLSGEEFNALIVDVDTSDIKEQLLESCRSLKEDLRFSNLPLIVLTYKKNSENIAGAINSGADGFLLKPFETDYLIKRMETIFKEVELKKHGKKLLDLHYLNFLVDLISETDREGFFLLAPIIFNQLVITKIKTILGDQVVNQMIKRLDEIVGADQEFMKKVKFQNSQILMNDVEKASTEVPVRILSMAFRNYVYAFLQLVKTLTSDILMEREAYI